MKSEDEGVRIEKIVININGSKIALTADQSVELVNQLLNFLGHNTIPEIDRISIFSEPSNGTQIKANI